MKGFGEVLSIAEMKLHVDCLQKETTRGSVLLNGGNGVADFACGPWRPRRPCHIYSLKGKNIVGHAPQTRPNRL